MVGGGLLAAAVAYAIVCLILWPLGLLPGVWWHVGMAVVGLFGLQFLMLGLLGEYIGRTFEEAKARPLYVIRETFGFPEPEESQPAVGPGPSERTEVSYTVYT